MIQSIRAKTLATLFICLSASATPVLANSCKTERFKKFNDITKANYVLVNQKPDPDLISRMDAYEIVCPWQVEQDFDGDRKRDWVGLIYKDKKYILAGFVTGGGRAKAFEIKSFDYFPIRTHFDHIRLKEFSLLADKKQGVSKSLLNGLVEYRIGKKAIVYQWDGTTMKEIGTFPGKY